MDAAEQAVARVGKLISAHVIARPSEELATFFKANVSQLEDLESYKVVDLRHLARTLEITTMDRSKIKYANKEQLIEAIMKHRRGGDVH